MRPDGMVYVYRLQGHDADWRVAYDGRVEYQDLPLGDYTFQVQAVDRDLNYSEPAQVQLSIVPDPHRQALAEALSAGVGGEEFVGQSPALRRVQEQLRQVAPAELTVLILGETGTGKGLAARTLHQLSPRRAASFIQVTCGALPEPLIESELFGHEKGAFTGAASRRLGKVELASGGTLFLDEIGDMPLSAQVKLLRLLEEGTFERVGGERVLEAQVRIVAATNRDLRQEVHDGTFREDLYFHGGGNSQRASQVPHAVWTVDVQAEQHLELGHGVVDAHPVLGQGGKQRDVKALMQSSNVVNYLRPIIHHTDPLR